MAKNNKTGKPLFRFNKHNSKVDNFIRESKGEFKYTKYILIILAIIALVLVFKPFDFLKQKLEEKRLYYASQSSYAYDIDFGDLNLIDELVYASSYKYYDNLRDTLAMPLAGGKLNAPYDHSHRGVDFCGYYGQEVTASADGTVVQTGTDKKHGNFIMIKHVINGYTIYTYYGNLGSIYVSENQYVTTGQSIGTITGSVSGMKVMDDSVYHVHFAVRKSTKESSGMNPLLFLYSNY